ncbi:MAG: hypothetical protein HZB26_24740 [Candidatus Hydrogenedentes bacterium]|nr:hypothetical protein [Candidatus Hydrogenedentota bacterium]
MRTLGVIVRAGLLVSALCLAGCHSYKKVSVNPDFSSGYPREEIRGSLFASDQAVLSNEDVERILTGQVTLPAKARLAVLKLGGYARHASTEHEQKAVEEFLKALGTSPRIASASMVPALLVPEKTSIPYLREAAAR